jgi:hypothetical protein
MRRNPERIAIIQRLLWKILCLLLEILKGLQSSSPALARQRLRRVNGKPNHQPCKKSLQK